MLGLLATALAYTSSSCSVAHCGGRALSPLASRSPGAVLLFEARWPWEERREQSSDDSGQFTRHSELQPGCSPLGVLCAGFSEDGLEALAQAIESTQEGPDGQMSYVPIAVVSKSDMRLRLRDVLADLKARDSVLPDEPCLPRVPLVLLSGFSTVATSATVRAITSRGVSGGKDDKQRPMFAVAVPNALDKSLSVLIDEIQGDHLANSGNEAP